MSYDPQYLGKNLTGRSKKAQNDFAAEVMVIISQATRNGALGSSATFQQFWKAGLVVLDREARDAMNFVYNLTGEHTGEPYKQVAFCVNRIVEVIMQVVIQKAQGAAPHGGMYADIVNRMQIEMNERKDSLLADFQHGMMGSERMKKDPVVHAVINQSNSPGAVAQVGAGTFSQSAFTQQKHQLIEAVEQALNSTEFAALSAEKQAGFRDIADVVKAEASSSAPDAGKLKRWGNTLVTFANDVGMKAASSAIAQVLMKIFM